MKKVEKNKLTKFEIALMSTLLFSIVFFFIYKSALILYFTKRYDDVLFAYTSNYYSVIFFCCFIIMGVTKFFDKNRKMKPKKYWTIFSCVGISVFLLVSYFSTRGWLVTKQDVSYNSFFTEKSVCYTYEDLENISLHYNWSTGIRMNDVSPEYKIKTNDGEIITLCLFESYYSSYENLIEFDKLVSDKRVCEGEYASLHIPKELNEYYKEIFNN